MFEMFGNLGEFLFIFFKMLFIGGGGARHRGTRRWRAEEVREGQADTQPSTEPDRGSIPGLRDHEPKPDT